DGVKLTINGTDIITNDVIAGAHDVFGTFTATTAGLYPLRLLHFQGTGGAELELFAAKGSQSSFNSSLFALVGDVANGGLQVFPNNCGDGVLQGNEQCDLGSGNGSSASCCSASCQFVTAGTTCRTTDATCYQSNTCSGSSGVCPSTPKANG